MKPQLAELVSVILRQLEEHADTTPSESRMRSWLAGQGYNKKDIDKAMAMIWPRVARVTRASEGRPGTVRQLSAFEISKLSSEARDALVRLDLFALIEPYEREMLLDRVTQFEGEVSLDDLDYLLSWILCSVRDVETQQTIYNVIDGERETLH